ncbi:MAG: MlaE family lipid ABC transporter permease subunit [Gammaproteobacteria bacterium]|nr:MlaE family lipid ABC transporter permease subunit [Gammaproteobacteria bacterium]
MSSTIHFGTVTKLENHANKAVVIIEKKDNSYFLRCNGEWTLKNIADVTSALKNFSQTTDKKSNVSWDISAIEEFDSAGIILLLHYVKKFKEQMNNVNIIGANSTQEKMLMMFQEEAESTNTLITKRHFIFNIFEKIGKNTVSVLRDVVQFISFLGESCISLSYYILQPSSIRFKAIIKNIEEAGVRALPIVAVTSFLIGIVVAYQGAVQLEKFGANIFIVDMIAISVTRELAPLITAIVVAGRSGSSYTAQIGVMKITEEIDAMKTMSFDPFRFLVLPRMIALMIAMPLLVFFADIVGISGGMFIAEIQMNLSYTEFIQRLQNVLEAKHLWIGIIKAPVFAWLIAAVGCFRGFQVSYNTESIGRYTTISVVNAIFLVIAFDALFSVVLTELGI